MDSTVCWKLIPPPYRAERIELARGANLATSQTAGVAEEEHKGVSSWL